MSVGEEVFEEVSYLDVKELKEIGGEEGVRKVLKELDDKFGRGRNRDKYDLIKKYFEMKKEPGESMRDYVNRYERVERECVSREEGAKLGEDMRCFHLLRGTCVREEKEQMVLAYCGKGAWKFQDFKLLINVLGGENETRVKRKEEGRR